MRNVFAFLLAVALGLTTLVTPGTRSASCCCAKMAAKSCPLQKTKQGCSSSAATCSITNDAGNTNAGIAANVQIDPTVLTNRVHVIPPLATPAFTSAEMHAFTNATAPPDPRPPRA